MTKYVPRGRGYAVTMIDLLLAVFVGPSPDEQLQCRGGDSRVGPSAAVGGAGPRAPDQDAVFDDQQGPVVRCQAVRGV